MYEQKISRANPQLIVILIDQSASMSELFFQNYSIAHTAKYITDNCLYEIMRNCVSGDEIRPYVDLAIIGYGTSVVSATPKIPMEQLPFSVTELQNSYIKRNEIDDSSIGDADEGVSKPRFEWVEEKSLGTTSMWGALKKAKEITEKWIANHRNSFPPMILNITDGYANDDPEIGERWDSYQDLGDVSTLDIVATVKDIQKLATTDGNVLLCNAHVSADEKKIITYPVDIQNIENPFAKLMFEMSSVIPDNLLKTGVEMALPVRPGSRLFLFNSEAHSLLNFLRFGTSAALSGLKESNNDDNSSNDGELEDKTNSGN